MMEADIELLSKFVELTKYYSVEAALDYLTVQRLGYDPEKYQIVQSDDMPWNAWVIDRETGFAEFHTGLYWKYIEIKTEITNKLYHELYRLSRLKVNEPMIETAEELQRIQREWKRVIG